MGKNAFACFAALATLGTIPVFAQIPGPKFEVASIKRSAPGSTAVLSGLPGGRFRADKFTLLGLISYAYEVPQSQIAGFPNWASSDRFDIEAIGEGAAESDPKKLQTPEKRAMVRQLLAERFKLEVRREEREVPVYSLVVLPGGSKIEPNTGKPYSMQRRSFQKVSMADLAKFLSISLRNDVGRTVVDKTGLTGEFDFKLNWAPMNPAAAPDPSGPPAKEELPSIFNAMQQIGLKLQSDRGMMPFVVVVNAAPPSEN